MPRFDLPKEESVAEFEYREEDKRIDEERHDLLLESDPHREVEEDELREEISNGGTIAFGPESIN